MIINAPRHYSSVWFYATLDFLKETDHLLLKLKEDVGKTHNPVDMCVFSHTQLEACGSNKYVRRRHNAYHINPAVKDVNDVQ